MRSPSYTDDQLAEDFDVDLTISEHSFAGRRFTVGEAVFVRLDDDLRGEGEDDGLYDGDTGVVVGFGHTAAARRKDRNYHLRVQFGTTAERWHLIVEFDGQDPREVDPKFLERLP